MSDVHSPYGAGEAQGSPGGVPQEQGGWVSGEESRFVPAPAGTGSGAAATPAASGTTAVPAAQVGAVLRRVGIGTPLPTFVIGALAYIAALCASLVVIGSAVLTVLSADTGSLTGGSTMPSDGPSSSSGGGVRGIIALLGIPIQLVSLASFGSYRLEMDLAFFGSATMSSRGLPLLITAAMVLTGFFAARFAQRRWSSNGPLGALLWTGISGLAVAIFAVIAARVTAFSHHDDELGMSVSMHSAGADMFFGTWALISIPMLLGHLAGWEKPAWWPVVADLAAAPRLALVHALTFAIPVGILAVAGGALAMLIDGDGDSLLPALLSLPIWGPTVLAFLPGLGMLAVPVHLNVNGDMAELGLERTNEYLWFFDLPWYAWIPMVLIALVVPLLVALLWNRDREVPAGSIPALVASWAALPVAYFGCSLILLALGWTNISADIPLSGRFGMNAVLGVWMPLMAFFLGLVIEVIARFGAPFVDRFLPGILVNWFRRSARSRRAAAAETAQDTVQDASTAGQGTQSAASVPSAGTDPWTYPSGA